MLVDSATIEAFLRRNQNQEYCVSCLARELTLTATDEELGIVLRPLSDQGQVRIKGRGSCFICRKEVRTFMAMGSSNASAPSDPP